MRTWRWHIPLWWARLSLLAYCLAIFFVSSRSRPEEELGLPTGPVMHFIEYAGLGVLAWVNMSHRRRRRPSPRPPSGWRSIFGWRRRAWKALAFSAFYAMTDEIHQAFVPMRSCELADWLVDVVGALAGIVVMEWLVGTRRLRIRISVD